MLKISYIFEKKSTLTSALNYYIFYPEKTKILIYIRKFFVTLALSSLSFRYRFPRIIYLWSVYNFGDFPCFSGLENRQSTLKIWKNMKNIQNFAVMRTHHFLSMVCKNNHFVVYKTMVSSNINMDNNNKPSDVCCQILILQLDFYNIIILYDVKWCIDFTILSY